VVKWWLVGLELFWFMYISTGSGGYVGRCHCHLDGIVSRGG
jgi:hypothetical protein